MSRHALRTASACWVATALVVAGCSRDIPLGSDMTSGGAPTSGRGGSGGNSATGGTGGSIVNGGSAGNPIAEGGAAGAPERECVRAKCHGTTYLCGDCMDNDG